VQALQLLSRQGKYFYLPRYQRQYAWTTENLKEFVSDVNGGLKLVIDGGSASRSALTFLGAAIFLPTTGSSTSIYPSEHRADAPQDISIVIDGQQRLTTLLMACAALASQIDHLLAHVPAEPSPMERAVISQALSMRNVLWRTLGEDRVGTGNNPFDYYPRMIREKDDLWSSDERRATYSSPIAELLHASLMWVHRRATMRWEQSKGAPLAFETSSDREVNTEFAHCYKSLCDLLAEVARGEDELQSPSAEQVFCEHTFVDFLRCAPDDIDIATLGEWAQAPSRTRQRGLTNPLPALARTVLFAEYLQHRVYVTEVTAPDEDNAFDLFQALNTRGEPLTAYETFKPVVMERVPRGPSQPRFAELSDAIDRIDNILADAGNADREALTRQLLIYAAAYESGHKLGKNIREQRMWLKGNLNHGPPERRPRTADELIDFVLGIDRVARSHQVWGHWQERHHHDHLLPDSFLEGRLAAEFLADAKHTIALPVLTPFIASVEATTDGSDARHQAQEELNRVVTALLATATLWRLAYGGTEGIDDAFRSVLSGDTAISRRRCPHPGPDRLSASMVVENLRNLLATSGRKSRKDTKDLLNQDSWVALAETQPVYRKVGKFTRLALAAAFDRGTPDATVPSQLEDTFSRDVTELSYRSRWWSYSYNVEHLVPQSKGAHLPVEILHGLGNLTLVPTWVNSSLSDKEWPRKRKLFKLMAERTDSGAQQYLKRLREEGLLESEETSLERVTKEGVYQEVAQSIAALPEVLTEDALRDRGRNLLERAHRRLLQWLA
jgi:hypothetical protein